jgi:hypothetical protein
MQEAGGGVRLDPELVRVLYNGAGLNSGVDVCGGVVVRVVFVNGSLPTCFKNDQRTVCGS